MLAVLSALCMDAHSGPPVFHLHRWVLVFAHSAQWRNVHVYVLWAGDAACIICTKFDFRHMHA